MNDLEIFSGARHQKTAENRAKFLTRVCDGDSTRRRRIEQILADAEGSTTLLECEPLSLLNDLDVDLDSRSGDHRVELSQLVLQKLRPTEGDSLGRLGHYRIHSVLGQGGFGVVLKATDTKLMREVAIKVLSPILSGEPEHQTRFLREARSVAAIRHENVVQIYAVEEHPTPYFVMELVTGGTLQQRLASGGRIPYEDVVRIGTQIARGLDAAHSKGIVHRDIKPANILLEAGSEGRVVLTDFGLAFSATDSSHVQNGQLIGTPAYMAPEQIVGGEVDRRTDLFSLGGVLYKMCSGERPFNASDSSALLRAVTDDELVPLSNRQSSASFQLAKLIEQLLSKKSQHRPESAKVVISEFHACGLTPKRGKMASKGILALLAVVVMFAVGLYTKESSTEGSNNAVDSAAMNLGHVIQSSRVASTADATEAESTSMIPKSAFPIVEFGKLVQKGFVAPLKKLLNHKNFEQLPAPMTAQELVDHVIADVQERNGSYVSDQCRYEIVDEIVVEFQTLFTVDNSPTAKLKDLETLFLRKDPRINFPANLNFLRGMKNLRTLNVDTLPLADLKPLKGMQLTSLCMWTWNSHNLEDGDLSPLRGMPLRELNCGGGRLRDLEPLRGAPIEILCANLTQVSDLSPLKGMPIRDLMIENTEVEDLTPLKGMPLWRLIIAGTKVHDLTPLIGTPVEFLNIGGLDIDDLNVLTKLPVKTLWMDYDVDRHNALLWQMPHIETVNGRSMSEYDLR